MSIARTLLRSLLATTLGLMVATTFASTASAGGLDRVANSDRPTASSKTTAAAVTAGASVNCSSVREIGTKRVVWDKGIEAFTVRQYIGWCWDSAGSAWMNFASVYVWDQYDNRGFSYYPQVGILVKDEGATRGFVTGPNRQQLTFSTPVRTGDKCTQGFGKLARSGGETALGLTSQVC